MYDTQTQTHSHTMDSSRKWGRRARWRKIIRIL